MIKNTLRLLRLEPLGLIALILLAFIGCQEASGSVPSEVNLRAYIPSELLLFETFELRAPQGTYINLQGINRCGGRALGLSQAEMICRFDEPGIVRVSLSLCQLDGKKCWEESREVNILGEKKEKGVLGKLLSFINPFSKSFSRPKRSHPKLAELPTTKRIPGFIQNNLTIAKKVAQRESRLVIFYFDDNTCTLCHLMKDLTFSDSEFFNFASDYVLVQLDRGSQAASELQEKLNVSTWPTLVLADQSFNEVSQLKGFASVQNISDWLSPSRDQPSGLGQIRTNFSSLNSLDGKALKGRIMELLPVAIKNCQTTELIKFQPSDEHFVSARKGVLGSKTFSQLQSHCQLDLIRLRALEHKGRGGSQKSWRLIEQEVDLMAKEEAQASGIGLILLKSDLAEEVGLTAEVDRLWRVLEQRSSNFVIPYLRGRRAISKGDFSRGERWLKVAEERARSYEWFRVKGAQLRLLYNSRKITHLQQEVQECLRMIQLSEKPAPVLEVFLRQLRQYQGLSRGSVSYEKKSVAL